MSARILKISARGLSGAVPSKSSPQGVDGERGLETLASGEISSELSPQVAEDVLAQDLAERISKSYDTGLGYMTLPWHNTVAVQVQAVRLFLGAHPRVSVDIDWGAAEFRFGVRR